jgi:hypothetical protein
MQAHPLHFLHILSSRNCGCMACRTRPCFSSDSRQQCFWTRVCLNAPPLLPTESVLFLTLTLAPHVLRALCCTACCFPLLLLFHCCPFPPASHSSSPTVTSATWPKSSPLPTTTCRRSGARRSPHSASGQQASTSGVCARAGGRQARKGGVLCAAAAQCCAGRPVVACSKLSTVELQKRSQGRNPAVASSHACREYCSTKREKDDPSMEQEGGEWNELRQVRLSLSGLFSH